MASKHITRLSRIEERAKAITSDVFLAYIGLLPYEDLSTLVDSFDEFRGASKPRLEPWLISVQPVPLIRPDIWQQAVRKVLDPNGLYDARESEDLAADTNNETPGEPNQ